MSFDTASQPVLAPPGATAEPDTTTITRRATPNLDYVFDDPADGEPGRDRMVIHGVWELVLVVALAGAVFLLYQEQSSALTGAGLRNLMISASILGAVAAASALCLRAGAPNLAVGAVAVAAALHFGRNSDGGLLQPMLIVIGVCAVIGLVQGALIVGLHVPAWAASLGVAMVMFAWSSRQAAVTMTAGYDPAPHAYYWFGGFCALSITASLVGLIPPVRRAFGRFRPVADPALRRGWIAGTNTLAAIVAASILAGVAGVLWVSSAGAAEASGGFELTALAIGAALLGGTSAYGRRGGIFGTVFAVALLAVLARYALQVGWGWSDALLGAAAIGVGLVVTRLVERFGRPRPAVLEEGEEDEGWMPKVHTTPEGRTWSTTTATSPGGIWSSDDAWGTGDRR
jgi:ribose/xylose/arabinose/galactoside ABC-type transport system permease subunit